MWHHHLSSPLGWCDPWSLEFSTGGNVTPLPEFSTGHCDPAIWVLHLGDVTPPPDFCTGGDVTRLPGNMTPPSEFSSGAIWPHCRWVLHRGRCDPATWVRPGQCNPTRLSWPHCLSSWLGAMWPRHLSTLPPDWVQLCYRVMSTSSSDASDDSSTCNVYLVTTVRRWRTWTQTIRTTCSHSTLPLSSDLYTGLSSFIIDIRNASMHFVVQVSLYCCDTSYRCRCIG